MIAIVIPVKQLAIAKSRLSPVLNDDQRQGLVETMLADVLRATLGLSRPVTVYVVSADPRIRVCAEASGATVLDDAANEGYNRAVSRAAEHCLASGHGAMLVLPADLPLVTTAEIEAVIKAGEQADLVLAPARDGFGTNAMLLSPPKALEPDFGPDSFRRHCATATKVDLKFSVIEQPGLGFDIDTPDDLRDLINLPTATDSQDFLNKIGVMA